jgi:UDP-galactopyranose mutase
MRNNRFLVVGAGFSGATIARKLVESIENAHVDIFEAKNHIAGNCFTSRDISTGIMVHRYGPHIFNTSRADVWQFVQRFGDFVPFVNRVKASLNNGIYSMPINLHTINQFFGMRMAPDEARKLIHSKADSSYIDPRNFEEQALSMMGSELYQAFFYGYTRKQWGCEPSELPASILKRLPMRFNYDDNYYLADFQAIPRNGYTEVVEAIIDHPRISLTTGARYSRSDSLEYDHVFYSGPIDEYFGFTLGRLGYRTVSFKEFRGKGDHIGNAVMNYPGMDVPYTRIHEHKHFAPWETHDDTIWFEEYSKETEAGDTPYYPKRLSADIELLARYGVLARAEKNVSFVGRLGTYRYLNMDQAIGDAIDFADSAVKSIVEGAAIAQVPPGVEL